MARYINTKLTGKIMKLKLNALRSSRALLTFGALSALALVGCSTDESTSETNTAESRKSAEFTRDVTIWPAIESKVKKDPKIEQAVADLLATMTLEQKVAQMIQPEIRDVTVEEMREYGFGSYLNGGGAFPNSDKHASAQDWITLAEDMYQASIDSSLDGSTIPTMWGTDAVHGHNNVIGATIFPHNIALGATHNPELIREIAEATAQEVMATGIDWVFAPTVAVVRDDRWGRTYEGYSEDPEIVGLYSASIVEGLQGNAGEGFLGDDRVISTVKHFIGDGGTETGDDQGDNISNETDLANIHAAGYFSGLEVGAQSVMASFNTWHGEKMHGHQYLLTTVLKERMGFDGFVVGDWNGHGQVKGCDNTTCPQAVMAGMDILMAPTTSWKELYENTIDEVKSGDITMARIDDAVTRILRVKMRAGIFDKPSPAQRPLAGRTELIGAESHREVARRAVRESLVLLKNVDNTLPLAPAQRVFVTGDAADNIGKQSGGWTITWQGTNNTNADFPGGSSIFAGIKATVEAAGGQVELGTGAEFSVKPDVAIVVFGEEPYAEGNGDLDNLEYQRGNKRDLALLQSLKAQGIPVVSLFISGRAMWVNPELNASNAFVATWLPGSEGKAVADVIFSKADGSINHDFKGKLSYSWPRRVDQATVNRHDETYDPLLPYGFGLKYGEENALVSTLDEVTSADGGADLAARALFSTGAKKPWSIRLTSNGTTSQMVSNSLTAGSISARTTDRNVQEDALQVDWDGSSPGKVSLGSDFPEDLRSFVENRSSVAFDVVRLKPVTGTITAAVGKGKVDITKTVRELSSDEWKTLSIDLRCFAKAGSDMGNIFSVFTLETDVEFSMQFGEVWLKPYSTAAADVVCRD